MASAAFADWSGWCAPAYSNGTTVGVLRFDATNEQRANLYAAPTSITYTNWLSPSHAVTNTYNFLDGLRVDVPPWGASVSVVRTYALRAYTGGVYAVTNYLTVTNRGALVATSVVVQARDAWAIDAYRACRERDVAAGLDPYDYTDNEPVFTPFGSYTDNRAFLVWSKARLTELIPLYVDQFGQTSRIWAAGITGTPQTLTITGALAMAGAPANYLAYTPWAQLGGTGTNFLQTVMTTRFVQVCSSNVVCTNYSRGVYGGGVTNIATNGALFSIVETNADIIAGRSSQDYGWKYMRPILTNLQQTASAWAWASNDFLRREYFREVQFAGYWTNICAAQWCTNQASNGVSFVQSLLWTETHALSAVIGNKATITGAPWYCAATNEADFAEHSVSRFPAFRYAIPVHTNGLALASQIVATARAYRRVSAGGTNYLANFPYPIAAGLTNLYAYSTNGSGSAVVWQWTNGAAWYRGPESVEASGAGYGCTNALTAYDSGDTEREFMTCTGGTVSVFADQTRASGGALDGLTIYPITVMDWTATTNGFRYK